MFSSQVAVTVLSAADPVRVFQEFATLDLLSEGRAEMVVGRGIRLLSRSHFSGSRWKTTIRSSPKSLTCCWRFARTRKSHWSGEHRAALTGQGIYPRPLQERLPIWLGVGGTPQSFIRAGMLGLPLMVAIIGGRAASLSAADRFVPPGYASPRQVTHQGQLKVGLRMIGFLGDTNGAGRGRLLPGLCARLHRHR